MCVINEIHVAFIPAHLEPTILNVVMNGIRFGDFDELLNWYVHTLEYASICHTSINFNILGWTPFVRNEIRKIYIQIAVDCGDCSTDCRTI